MRTTESIKVRDVVLRLISGVEYQGTVKYFHEIRLSGEPVRLAVADWKRPGTCGPVWQEGVDVRVLSKRSES